MYQCLTVTEGLYLLDFLLQGFLLQSIFYPITQVANTFMCMDDEQGSQTLGFRVLIRSSTIWHHFVLLLQDTVRWSGRCRWVLLQKCLLRQSSKGLTGTPNPSPVSSHLHLPVTGVDPLHRLGFDGWTSALVCTGLTVQSGTCGISSDTGSFSPSGFANQSLGCALLARWIQG